MLMIVMLRLLFGHLEYDRTRILEKNQEERFKIRTR